MKKNISCLLLFCFGVFVAFLIAEVLFRIYASSFFYDHEPNNQRAFIYHHEDIGWMKRDETLYWRFNPGRFEMACPEIDGPTQFFINNDGVRHSSPISAKKEGVTRIVCLGDSTTFGVDLQDSSTYPALLQKEFDRQYGSGSYEIINAGVPGYTAYQGLELLREKYETWDPDIITLYFGENDNYDVKRFYQELEHNMLKRVDESLRRNLRIYSFFKKIKQSVEMKVNSVSNRVVHEEIFIDNLNALVRFAHGKKIDILMVTYPTYNEVYSAKEHAYNKVIREIATKNDVFLIDLVAAFRKEKENQLFTDNLHHTSQGSRIVAEALFRAIKKEERNVSL
jgi:lysophospholipase L1-like esterase